MFENSVLRRIFELKSEKVTEGWRKFIMRSFINRSLHLGHQIKEDDIDGACSTHGRNERCMKHFVWKT
jgi:hypothetical protein